MNSLLLGSNTTQAILDRLEPPYLLIDDGPLIDQLPQKGLFTKDSHLNILKDMDYRKAVQFVEIINVLFPEGANTLTRKNSNFLLLEALLDKPKQLDTLIVLDEKNPTSVDAYQKIRRLLMSPVLRHVFSGQYKPSKTGVVLARLPRAELGDFDCLALAHFLIASYPHQVVIPDFGFYGRDYLTSLAREERLIAGVRTLSELSPILRQELLLMDKEGHGTTYDDAVVLANYEGKPLNANKGKDFIEGATST